MMRWTAFLCFVLAGLVPHTQSQEAGKSSADDWVVATPATVGLSPEPLAAMEKAIRATDFKKILMVFGDGRVGMLTE